VQEGKECIDYLRKNSLGRASFMILEKLRDSPQMESMNPPPPPGSQRLFDLVKPSNPIYRKAFYKALGDTLVADNLDEANRIAFGGTRRYRVVTLDGQLIEPSGAMSGGGSTPSRGAMSAKQMSNGVTPQVLRDYEADAQKMAQALQEAQEEVAEAEAAVERLTKEEPSIQMDFQKLGMEIATRTARIADLTKRVKGLRCVDLSLKCRSPLSVTIQCAKQARCR